MNVTKFLASLTFAALLGAGLALTLGDALGDALSLPEVHKSHSSGECKKIVTFDEGRPVDKKCPETLPARYTLVWVK